MRSGPITWRQIEELLAAHPELGVNLSSSLKAGLATGACTVAGAILLGPVGILAGAAIGSGIAYRNTGNFTPLHQIIKDMSEDDRAKLLSVVNSLVLENEVDSLTPLLLEQALKNNFGLVTMSR